MSCCGKKRQALNASKSGAPRPDAIADTRRMHANNSASPQTGVEFRYTGNRSLDVKGVFNRRIYRFSVDNPECAASSEDVALLRGYSELMEIKSK
jgi:hypothetical protein